MTGLEAVALYTGLLLLLFIGLKMNVGRVRSATKIAIGDGGNENLIRAMRAQANAVEDVPMAVIGLLLLAGLQAPVWLIHTLGAGLVVSRLLHAIGLGRSSGVTLGRALGTLGTAIVFVVTAGACIWLAVS